MNESKRYRIGPAVFVTAAFIGPGTVLSASKAGAQFGFALLWAVIFSVIATIILQEMAARLGIVSGKGLAEAIRSVFSSRVIRWSAIVLVLGAILFGNSAYQTGNIVGAASGLEILTSTPSGIWSWIIAVIAMGVIAVGRFDILQWILTILVGLMGLIFVSSAFACGPELLAIVNGLKPAIPDGSEWIIVGLIGTTVVPYNLFLHASGAAERYRQYDDRRQAVRDSLVDTFVSIVVGGIITASLLITAAVTFADSELRQIKDIADQMRPSLGAWAERIFAIGLFAAGLTSSITAPIAAAYATAGCFGWRSDLGNLKLKLVASAVVVIGLAAALKSGRSPQETIIIAQIANGLLLPLVAVFLIYTLNRKSLMGSQKNGWLANALGVVVVVATLLIATRQFHSVMPHISRMFGAD